MHFMGTPNPSPGPDLPASLLASLMILLISSASSCVTGPPFTPGASTDLVRVRHMRGKALACEPCRTKPRGLLSHKLSCPPFFMQPQRRTHNPHRPNLTFRFDLQDRSDCQARRTAAHTYIAAMSCTIVACFKRLLCYVLPRDRSTHRLLGGCLVLVIPPRRRNRGGVTPLHVLVGGVLVAGTGSIEAHADQPPVHELLRWQRGPRVVVLQQRAEDSPCV